MWIINLLIALLGILLVCAAVYVERKGERGMNTAELVKALRCDGKVAEDCRADECPYISAYGWCDESNKMAKDAADAIEALQDEVERLKPKEGEWVEDEYGFVHCSLCGMEWDEPEHAETNYCPNCGAKMGKEKDDG